MTEPRVRRKGHDKQSISILEILKEQFKPATNLFKGILREQIWRMNIIRIIDTKALNKRREKIIKLGDPKVKSEHRSAYFLNIRS